MAYLGEILALAVAFLWTTSSLSSEYASKHYGSVTLNIIRMVQAILMIGLSLLVCTGTPIPLHTSGSVWMWLTLSAITGYVIGDYFFLRCFMMIGARWGELFMTVAPVAAAVTGLMLLGEKMSGMAITGMLVTISGIALSVLSKPEGKKRVKIKLPLKGVVFGLIAGIGQGVGLVFSKQGILLYQEQLNAFTQESTIMDSFYVSFGATMIRCLVALAGFMMIYAYQKKTQSAEYFSLGKVFNDKKAIGLATLSTVTGPFVGVALSLAASMFTSTGITQTIMSLVPVLILWPSHIFFHSKITPLEIVGAVISVCGVAMFFV